MECKICGRLDVETELAEGIFKEKIELICSKCASAENIPLIKKPNLEVLNEKRENLTVRERMERMNNPKKEIPKEQFITHKNLAKLKFPTKREDHQDLVENYDWILKTARRRKKLSQTQLAEELIMPLQVILDLESGKIANDFEQYVEKLESFLEVRIRNKVPEKFNFSRKPETLGEENIVLESVKNKMNSKNGEGKKELDLSDKKSLKNLTLRDIINFKRKKEKSESSDILGDEVEIEE